MAKFVSFKCISSLFNLSRTEILKFSLIFDQMDQTKNSDVSNNVWHWKLKKSDLWVNSDNLRPESGGASAWHKKCPLTIKIDWGWGGAYPICGRIWGLRWVYLRLRWGYLRLRWGLSETSKNTAPPRAPNGTKKRQCRTKKIPVSWKFWLPEVISLPMVNCSTHSQITPCNAGLENHFEPNRSLKVVLHRLFLILRPMQNLG